MIQHNNITIEPTATPFGTLALAPAVLTNLMQLDYTNMIPVQTASLPITFAGHNLIAWAETGGGKATAFALALLAQLGTRSFSVQAIVLYPMHELADRIAQEIRRLARAEENVKALTLCDDTPMRPQAASLEHGARVIVGIPGRIMDHLGRDNLGFGTLKTLVLNEANRMLDMGFFGDIATAVRQHPADRQTLLFSAMYPENIVKLSQRILRNLKEVKLGKRYDDSKIRQHFYEVTGSQRLHTVGQLFRHYRPVSTLAFYNTEQQCRDLPDVLRAQDIRTLVLHDEFEQCERNQIPIQFMDCSCSVLVAADVAARGSDIAQFEVVISIDVTSDPEVHVHRIGRTGRADENGWVLSLASMDETGRIGNIEQTLGYEVERYKLDELDTGNDAPLLPPMEVLQILGGCKEKIHPGDVPGALAGDAGFRSDRIGKINVTESSTYVTVEYGIAHKALRKLNADTMKGKGVGVRLVDE